MTNLFRYPQSDRGLSPSVAAIGNFDGLHLGHQSLIKRIVEISKAKGLVPALISFSPHPATVLGGVKVIPEITSLRQKLEILSDLGISELILIHFTEELSKLEPEDFLLKIVFEALQVKHLIIGPDARVGKDRKGDTNFMLQFAKEKGVGAEIMPFVEQGGIKPSSREIRAKITAGDVVTARTLLGRPLQTIAKVVSGDKRGRELSFPTANLATQHQIVPANGVYVVKMEVKGKEYLGVCNVGMRPTFSGQELRVEVHLPDYKGESFYGERVSVFWYSKLRDEKKFNSLDELKIAISNDISQARKARIE